MRRLTCSRPGGPSRRRNPKLLWLKNPRPYRASGSHAEVGEDANYLAFAAYGRIVQLIC
jgi:hypothetical protein